MAEEWPTEAAFKTLRPYWALWYWNCINSVKWIAKQDYPPEKTLELTLYYQKHAERYKEICERYGVPLGDNPENG